MKHRLFFLAAVLSTAGSTLPAQTALSLGDAARLAAKQSGGVDVARQRVAQAEARVTQRRGALFPDLAAGIQQAERNLNSATFGFSFSNPVTGQPLLRPDGEIIGPVPTVDVRYRLQQPLLDPYFAHRAKVIGVDVGKVLHEGGFAGAVTTRQGLVLRIDREATPAHQRIHVEREFDVAVRAKRARVLSGCG